MKSLAVEQLGKCYRLGTGSGEGWHGRLMRRFRRDAAEKPEEVRELWALRDVSFSLDAGTVLGVIGANGAGKSTLLKILARVITPTTGRVVGVGRVVSLLELGAGFDPDLTARDNIYMNAAMLGVPRSEVARRFDHIIEFAEAGRFIDTPLRHYSSGMYLRLAFSVAINMNPSILLADEILAVGDLAFQERCLRKVQEEAERGLTVLFVSHDMDAILRVCNRAIWLNSGQLLKDGNTEEVVDEYQNAAWSSADVPTFEKGRHINRFARIVAVNLVSGSGREIGGAPIGEDVVIRIRFETTSDLIVKGAMDLYSRGVWVLRASDDKERRIKEAGTYEATVRIPAHMLAPSKYSINVSLTMRRKNEVRDYTLVVYNALQFMAYAGDDSGLAVAKRAPLLAPRLEWEVSPGAVKETHAVGG